MSGSEIVVSVRDLSVRYETEAGLGSLVLSDVSFDVFRGQTLVIMGGSGGGKSTLLPCGATEVSLTKQDGSREYERILVGHMRVDA